MRARPIFVSVLLLAMAGMDLANPSAAASLDPALESALATAKQVRTVIALRRGIDLDAVKRQVRATHLPDLEAIRAEFARIAARNRPDGPLDEPDEHAFQRVVRVSADDQALMDGLLERLDAALARYHRALATALTSALAGDFAALEQVVTEAGGVVLARVRTIGVLEAALPASAVPALAESPLVERMTLARFNRPQLKDSIPTSGHPVWWANGIDGFALDIGIADTGVDESHPAFAGIVFHRHPDSVDDDAEHGTHVLGIAASRDAQHTGGSRPQRVAWGRACGDSEDFSTVTTLEVYEFGLTLADTPEVFNHSCGFDDDDALANSNGIDEPAYDDFVHFNDLLIVQSAGNDGWSSSPNLKAPARAHNIITVGGMKDKGDTDRDNDVRADFSSVGPVVNTDRRKPDLVAPAKKIDSANHNWEGILNADFVNRNGTSMAAPHVTSAVLLMMAGGEFDPKAIKAVLINTADAYSSNNTETLADDVRVYGSNWDKAFGWGYLDLSEAHFNRTDVFVDSVVAQNGSPVDDDYKLYKGIMFPNEKATLVFHQHALSLNQLSALWLRLYDENDGSLVAIDNRPADNVQQVAAESITGPWVEAVLKVHSVGDYFHDEDDEEYALATEEHFVRANPPILSYTQPWPEWMGPAASWQHTVTVFNDGDVAAHNVEVTVGAVAGVSGTGTVSIGTVAAGGSATADFSFQVTATLEGAFTVPVDINSDSYGENYHHGVETGLLFLIDSVPPSTACSVPGFVPGDSVQVDWEADDDASGISHVVVYFKGPGDTEFTSYLGISDATSGSWNQIFDGRDGLWHFAVQATDNSGNIEPLPTEAECSTLRVSLAP